MMFLLMVRVEDPLVPRAMFGILNTLLYFPSGAIYPVQAFPQWLRVISYVDPFSYAVHGLKATLLKDASWAAVHARSALPRRSSASSAWPSPCRSSSARCRRGTRSFRGVILKRSEGSLRRTILQYRCKLSLQPVVIPSDRQRRVPQVPRRVFCGAEKKLTSDYAASGVICTSKPRFWRRFTSRRTCFPLARRSKCSGPRSS